MSKMGIYSRSWEGAKSFKLEYVTTKVSPLIQVDLFHSTVHKNLWVAVISTQGMVSFLVVRRLALLELYYTKSTTLSELAGELYAAIFIQAINAKKLKDFPYLEQEIIKLCTS